MSTANNISTVVGIGTQIHTIYFYYMTYPEGGDESQPVVKVYYHHNPDRPIDPNEQLIGHIKELALNAKVGDFLPPCCGQSFSAVRWRKKSYFVILLDDPVDRFADGNGISIQFTEEQEEGAANHSFFNARALDIELPWGTVTALCCVNLMQSSHGGDLGDDQIERFNLDIRSNARMLHIDAGAGFEDGDDGGTNQGGPIPPFE